jgi:hypothetical protein
MLEQDSTFIFDKLKTEECFRLNSWWSDWSGNADLFSCGEGSTVGLRSVVGQGGRARAVAKVLNQVGYHRNNA